MIGLLFVSVWSKTDLIQWIQPILQMLCFALLNSAFRLVNFFLEWIFMDFHVDFPRFGALSLFPRVETLTELCKSVTKEVSKAHSGEWARLDDVANKSGARVNESELSDHFASIHEPKGNRTLGDYRVNNKIKKANTLSPHFHFDSISLAWYNVRIPYHTRICYVLYWPCMQTFDAVYSFAHLVRLFRSFPLVVVLCMFPTNRSLD